MSKDLGSVEHRPQAAEETRSGPHRATSNWKEVLRRQEFSENGPGTVVRDFETLLDFIGPDGVRSTGKYHLLPLAGLKDLDERMAAPLRPRLERPQQSAFPQIHGLYLLLRVLRLAKAEGMGKATGRLVLDPVMVAQWRQLNPTEKYFTLLEALCDQANSEIFGEHSHGAGLFLETFAVTVACPLQGQAIGSFDELQIYQVFGAKSQFKIALPELFGLIEVTRGEQQERDGWVPRQVQRTPFGDALLRAFATDAAEEESDNEPEVRGGGTLMTHLITFSFRDDDLESDEDHPEESSSADQTRDVPSKYRRRLAPYFPAWQQGLHPPEPEFRDGVYQFKVSLGSAWRRIAFPADTALDYVAEDILAAFKFDNEHLYEFSLRNVDGTVLKIAHPSDEVVDTAEYADNIALGHLPLAEKETMHFLYDFGDDWKFKLVLEKIDPPNARLKRPNVIEKHGTAPKQYGDDDW